MSQDVETNSESDSFNNSSSEHDEIPAHVANARDAWAKIEEQQQELAQLPTEVGVGGVIIDRGYPITFFDARAYLIEQAEKIECQIPILPMLPSRCFCLKSKPNNIAIDAWSKIFRITKIPFDENDTTHHRILNSINQFITGVQTAPPRKGEHWLTIGFQSQDPITDLRSAGMFGLLMPLMLFSKYEALGKIAIETSRLPEQNFNLMQILIVLAFASIQMITETDILQTCESFTSCWDKMSYFFLGMISTLCIEWKRDFLDMEHDYNYFDKLINRSKSRPILTINNGINAVKSNDTPAKNIPIQEEL